jgi:PKD repeat protein
MILLLRKLSNITEIKNNDIIHNIYGPGLRFDEISTADTFFNELKVTNNVIAYNSAGHSTRGGGISLRGSHPKHKTALTNNTIFGNMSPGNGGGVKIETIGDDQNYNFSSNIIMNNTASGLGYDIYIENDKDQDYIYSSVEMRNNNFDQSEVGFFIKEPVYVLKLDPSNLNNQNPLFVASGTDDFHLSEGSPCINTGNNEATELAVYDREGNKRIMDGIVDMGAYEYPGTILPVALFSVSSTEGFTPLTVAFSDESIGTITTWAWMFGDGGSSSEKNPSHTYTEAGKYSVSLSVTGPHGSTVETKNDLIVVDSTPPVAVAGPDRAVALNEVTLDGGGSSDVDGSIVSYNWELTHRTDSAHNQIATGVNPTITDLAADFYDVQLVVTDDDGLTSTDTMVLAVSGPLCQTQIDRAVAEAEAAKDLVIAAKDKIVAQKDQAITGLNATVASMFTKDQFDTAILNESEKWDINGDGKVSIEEAIYALKIASGVQPE